MTSRFHHALSGLPYRPLPGAALWPVWLIVLGGMALGLVLAYLLILGLWYIAAALLFALPALIVIHRHPFVSVLIWLALTPFLLHTQTATERYVYWGVHRALPLLTLLLIGISAGLRVRRRELPRLGPAEWAMAGYVVASIVSILLLSHQPRAMIILFYDRIIVAMCLYLIIRLSEPTEREMSWLLVVAVFIVLSQSAVGILSQFAPGLLPSVWMENAGERTVGTLINAAIYTIALVFGGLILLHAAQQTKSAWRRALFVLCFLFMGYCIFISFSRASWLGGLLVMGAVLVVYPRFTIKMGLVVIPVVALLAGFVLSEQLEWARHRIYSAEAENSATSRLPIMVAAYSMFQRKPAFGWGYGNFDQYDRSFYGILLGSAGDNKDHASHNYFLTILAEQGLTGITLYMMPAAIWAIESARRYSDLPARGVRSRKLLLMLWAALLFHFVVSNFMNIIVVYGLGIWWIALGLVGYLISDRRLRKAAPAPVHEARVATRDVPAGRSMAR